MTLPSGSDCVSHALLTVVFFPSLSSGFEVKKGLEILTANKSLFETPSLKDVTLLTSPKRRCFSSTPSLDSFSLRRLRDYPRLVFFKRYRGTRPGQLLKRYQMLELLTVRYALSPSDHSGGTIMVINTTRDPGQTLRRDLGVVTDRGRGTAGVLQRWEWGW